MNTHAHLILVSSILAIPVIMFILMLIKLFNKKVVVEGESEFSHSIVEQETKIVTNIAGYKKIKILLTILVLVSIYFMFTYINQNLNIVSEFVKVILNHILSFFIMIGVLFFSYVAQTDINIIFAHSFIIFSAYIIIKIIFGKFSWKSIFIVTFVYIIFMILIYILKMFFNSPLNTLLFFGSGFSGIRNRNYRR